MTSFQKDIIQTLEELGWKPVGDEVYQLNATTPTIDVHKIEDEFDLFKVAFEAGQTSKMWEFQTFLGIYGI